MSEPTPDRPDFPAGYGISKEPPPPARWSDVEARLATARNYWIATARSDGRPHVMPVWGLWLDGLFAFSTDPASRKGRNLAANQELVMHLESGDDVVIVEGRSEEVDDPDVLRRFADAYSAKYDWRFEPRPGSGVYALRPRAAFTWSEHDFPQSATRWRWPASD